MYKRHVAMYAPEIHTSYIAISNIFIYAYVLINNIHFGNSFGI